MGTATATYPLVRDALVQLEIEIGKMNGTPVFISASVDAAPSLEHSVSRSQEPTRRCTVPVARLSAPYYVPGRGPSRYLSR